MSLRREGGGGEGTKRAKRKTRIERSSRKEEIERGREEDGEDACREARRKIAPALPPEFQLLII